MKIANILLILAAVMMSWSGFAGFPFLGELKSDAITYFVMLLGVAVIYGYSNNGGYFDFKTLLKLAAPLWVVVVLSAIFNIDQIFSMDLRGRTGINKFLTSVFVLIYGFFISLIVSLLLNRFYESNKDYKTSILLILKPICYGVIVLMPVIVLEVHSWFAGNALIDFLSINYFTSTYEFTEFRVRGLSAEPSFFAIFCVFVFTVLLVYRRDVRMGSVLLFIVVLLIALTQSRTAYLSSFVVVAGYIFWKLNLIGLLKTLAYSLVIFIPIMALLVVGFEGLIVSYLMANDVVSNISRLSSIFSAMLIFQDNFYFGVGLGQYAFHAIDYFPDWAGYSYEVARWFNDFEATWPPTFNLYTRLLAELGLIGYLSFFLMILYIFYKCTLRVDDDDSLFPILILLYGLTVALSFDSFRSPFFWTSISICLFYIKSESYEKH